MRFPFADAHCDYLYCDCFREYDIVNPIQGQMMSIDRMLEGNVKLQCFAVWTDKKLRMTPLQQAMNMIDVYHCILDTYDDICEFDADFDESSGRIATVLTMEGGEPIGYEIANLHNFYRLGVRAMALTWNYPNQLAYPATKQSKKGLTEFGKYVVEEMGDLGMAIDLAHLSDVCIDDVLCITSVPVYASHSNARAVYNHPRSLDDEHIREIAKRGGVIGTNFYYAHLAGTINVSTADVVRHIAHMAEVGGIDCVCIGSDYDGMGVTPVDLRDSSELQNLAAALIQNGFTEDEVAKITYYNLRNYLARFCL